MGKPSSSCLKIIACGSDSPVEDDIQTAEAKGSGDKRGWSFRKRSARHRVLSNNVTAESVILADKEVPQSTSFPSQAPAHPSFPEKVVALEQTDEKHLPPSSVEVKPAKSIEPELSETLDAAKPPKPVQPVVSETLYTREPQEPVEPEVSEAVHASESPELGGQKTYDTVFASEAIATVDATPLESPVPIESKTSEGVVPPESPETIELISSENVVASQDDVLEEHMVLDIQSGVRGFLAQRELVKLRSIVKLQAAIRGHLVRRQAVDTLYCMQGIVKVQSLVKARHSKTSGDEIFTSQSSIEKLLKNAFSRQLLNSTPKSKPIVTKCDPLKPSPSRLWLERWMDLYSYGLANLEIPEITTKDEQSQVGRVAPRVEPENLLKVTSDSINPENAVKEASKTMENGKSSINPDPVEECRTFKLLSNEEKMEQPCENSDTSFEGPLGAKQKNQSIRSSSHSQPQSGSLSNDVSVETEDPKLSTKSMPSIQVEVESKKLAYGSRKSSNPSFVAAQSKFEELSSTPNYSGSLGSTYQVSGAEYHLDTASSRESVIKEKEPSGADSLAPYEMRINMGGSENGTELSVTSALDSPYLSEAEAAEVDLEVKFVEERSTKLITIESLEVETKGSSTVRESDSYSDAIIQEFHQSSKPVVAADSHQPKQELEPVASDEHNNSEYVGLEMAADSLQVEQKAERSASDVQVDAASQTEKLAHNSSPGASPNNSHRTPSSQVSGKVKKSKVDKRTPAKPLDDSGVRSSGKRTPAKPLDDFGVKSSGKRTPTKPLDDSGGKSSGKRTPNKPLDDSGVRSSAEQLSKDQKSERRRNSFGSTKSDNADQEPRDSTSSTKIVPSYMQATKSAKAKANSPRSSPDVQDNDTYMIKKRHSLPGAGGRQGSPRVQRPASQAPQSQPLKGNANTPPQERKWVR